MSPPHLLLSLNPFRPAAVVIVIAAAVVVVVAAAVVVVVAAGAAAVAVAISGSSNGTIQESKIKHNYRGVS
ncbi:hypothetical protein ElyMa_002349000 [Elysia marginata]|uniref:Uncharacterized protein n=1 Tax=Elysia marginata TaxID=1093978 RepID=A0AAV4G9W4_9GAST|nr:hypothetical protein ElyMa_002349000 [Elysia marginata]